MLLTEPLDEASRALLDLIHHGSGGGSGDWPVWQWVAGHAAERGLDAEAVLRGPPEWQTHFRPVRERTLGGVPQPQDRLGLTVHGLVQVDDTLLPTFLATLAEASQARSGLRGDERRLYELLEGEPATWSGHTEPGPGRAWSWDLTRAGLRRFAGVTTGPEYLQRLEGLVGRLLPPARPEAWPLPPLAVPQALDHLDARWLLHTGRPLLVLQRRAGRPARPARHQRRRARDRLHRARDHPGRRAPRRAADGQGRQPGLAARPAHGPARGGAAACGPSCRRDAPTGQAAAQRPAARRTRRGSPSPARAPCAGAAPDSRPAQPGLGGHPARRRRRARRAAHRWRQLAGVGSGPLLRPVGKSNTAGAGWLHPESINTLVQKAVARAGLDPAPYSDHSLRAGFVTYAHLRGASDQAIAHQTRHRSLATLGSYDRVQQAWTDNAATTLGL